MRDEGKLYTYLVPQAKRNRASAFSRSFSLSLTFGDGNSPSENPQQLYAPPFLLSHCFDSPLWFPFLFSSTPSKTPLQPFVFLFFFLCLGFAFPTFSTAATFFLAELLLQPPFCLLYSSCSHLFLSLSLYSHLIVPLFLRLQKGEVDSLWPLRMRHVARWDSGTWLRM